MRYPRLFVLCEEIPNLDLKLLGTWHKSRIATYTLDDSSSCPKQIRTQSSFIKKIDNWKSLSKRRDRVFALSATEVPLFLALTVASQNPRYYWVKSAKSFNRIQSIFGGMESVMFVWDALNRVNELLSSIASIRSGLGLGGVRNEMVLREIRRFVRNPPKLKCAKSLVPELMNMLHFNKPNI
jgi:hypothetical protein